MGVPQTTNSSTQTSASIIGGVYSLVPPVPIVGQGVPLQVDSNGNLLVNVAVGGGGGGSGTQYVDGVTQATPTGTVAFGKNPSNILHSISLDAFGNLNVNLAAGSISGGNAAASPTGAVVPVSADYTGFNLGGNLVGVSAANPLPVAQQGSVAVTGAFFQATQPVSLAAAVDVSDRVARLLGHVTVDNASLAVTGSFFQATQPVSLAAAVDVSDRAARLVGHVTVDNASLAVTGSFFQATQPVSLAAAVDVSDRAARLVGVVYGSQGQQLKQTVTNFNAQVELATGATLYDARQIRALTSADVVSVAGTSLVDVTDRSARLLGHVTVDNASLAVTGTFFQATQPVSGTFFQATQPISAASLPLPSGAATDASVTGLQVAQASTTAGEKGPLVQGAVTTAAPTYTTAQTNPLSLTTAGALRVDGSGVTQPVSIAATVSENLAQISGSPVVAAAVGVQKVGIVGNTGASVDSTAAAGAAPTNAVLGSHVFNTTVPAPTAGQAVAQQSDSTGSLLVSLEGRKASYNAAYRLADATAGQLTLTFTFVANTNKQLATIYHAAGATKTVKIHYVSITPSTGALGVFDFEIRPLSATTAPATGNPAITPGKFAQADAAAEATCLALPTTAGSLVAADAPVSGAFEWNSAAAAAIGNPSGLSGEEIVLFSDAMPGVKPLTMRSATAEGYAINGRSTTAVALRFTVRIVFTEE